MVYLLEFNWFEQKKVQNLRPKNCLQEIAASNLEGPLLKFQYSRPLFTITFKLKNDNFKTRDFSPLIERGLAGVCCM